MIWRILALLPWIIIAGCADSRTLIDLHDARLVNGDLHVLIARTDGYWDLLRKGQIEGTTRIREYIIHDGASSSNSLGSGKEYTISRYRYKFAGDGVIGITRTEESNWNNKGTWLFDGKFHDVEMNARHDFFFFTLSMAIGVARDDTTFCLAQGSGKEIKWSETGVKRRPIFERDDHHVFDANVYATETGYVVLRYKYGDNMELFPIPGGSSVKLPPGVALVGFIVLKDKLYCVFRDRSKNKLDMMDLTGEIVHELSINPSYRVSELDTILLVKGGDLILVDGNIRKDMILNYSTWNLEKGTMESKQVPLK